MEKRKAPYEKKTIKYAIVVDQDTGVAAAFPTPEIEYLQPGDEVSFERGATAPAQTFVKFRNGCPFTTDVTGQELALRAGPYRVKGGPFGSYHFECLSIVDKQKTTWKGGGSTPGSGGHGG